MKIPCICLCLKLGRYKCLNDITTYCLFKHSFVNLKSGVLKLTAGHREGFADKVKDILAFIKAFCRDWEKIAKHKVKILSSP